MSVVSFPTRTFTALVADYRKVAEDAGLAWNQRLSGTGAVARPERWNLTEIAGSPGETIYLSHLGTDKKTLAEMNRRRAQRGELSMEASALPRGWQDLLRTLVVKHLVAEKKTPGHAAWNVAHPARCLATCCFPKEPWETTAARYADGAPLHRTVEVFAKRSRQDGMPWRHASTAELAKPRQRFARGQMVVRVSDLEDFLRERRSTKLSDQTPFLLSSGRTLPTDELLFLHPKRALNEGRNGGVCDITRYPFVGHLQPEDIQAALQDRDNGLFAKYGEDEESRTFELNSHSIRHLHNNELFSAGVSDTVITHRFGRKTVAQSHEYDNRTVERLRRLVVAQPGQSVFPDGDDHGSPYAPKSEGLR